MPDSGDSPLRVRIKSQASPADLTVPSGSASIHLDALRGVAAIGVLLSHWRDCLFLDYPDIHHHDPVYSAAYLLTGLGHQWVVVYFVLSGYLVGGSVLRQVTADRWSWGDYALTRLTRLYTVLIPALVLGGLIDSFGLHLFGTAGIYGGHTGAHMIGGLTADRLSLPIMFGNYFFLQAIWVPVLGSNGPLWSLSYEFWYYAAFPFGVSIFWRKLKATRRLVSAFLLVVVVLVAGKQVALLGLIWLMGAAIHWLPIRRASTPLRHRMLLGTSVLLTILTLAWCKKSHFAASDFVLGVVVTTLVYLILSSSQGSLPAAYTHFAQHTAKSSYTLYLVHVPAIIFLTAWIGQTRWQPDGRHLLFALGLLVLVFLYAQIVYFLFERNTSSIRTWLKPRVLKV